MTVQPDEQGRAIKVIEVCTGAATRLNELEPLQRHLSAAVRLLGKT